MISQLRRTESTWLPALVLVVMMMAGGIANAMPYPGEARLVGFSPADLAANVAPDAPVTVSFAGVADPGFYQGVQFSLFEGSAMVDADLFYNPGQQQVMLKAKTPLKMGQTYTVQLSYQPRPDQGPQSKIWRFQIGRSTQAPGMTGIAAAPAAAAPPTNIAAAPATTASGRSLAIVGASVANGAMPSPQSPLTVTFSEPLDVNCLRDAPVRLLVNRQPIGVDYQLNKALTTLTIVPRQPLPPGTDAGLALTQQLAGKTGTRLAQNTLIPFKVAGGGNTAAQLAMTPGAREVPVVGAAATAVRQPMRNQAVMTPGQMQNAANTQWPVANGMNDTAMGETEADAAFQSNLPVPSDAVAPGVPIRNPVPVPAYPTTGYTPANVVAMNGAAAPATVPQPATPRAGAAPQIVAVSPSMSEPVTNPSQPVLVTFDREVKGETVNEFTFRLEDDFGPVPAKIQYLRNRRQAVLAPIGLLESGKRYRVVATQGIVDLAGKPLARPWTSAFVVQSPVRGPAAPQMSAQATTNRAPTATHSGPQDPEFAAESGDAMSGTDAQEDLAALGQLDNAPSPAPRTAGSPARSAAAPRRERLETVKVLGVWPSNGATEVPRDCRIRMRFNQQMDPNTITAINIALFGRETRVEGSVKYDPNSREVTFAPVEPLYPDTEYKIVMSDKIRSISGEPMVQRYRWAFTTTQASLSNYARLQAPRTQRTGFSIPLADKKRAARPVAAKAPAGNDGSWAGMSAMLRGNGNANNANSFPLLKSGHWAFKTINHLKGVGLLANNPFPSTAKVTRYEMAMAVNSALTNLNTLRQSAHPPRIALNDLIQLEHLIVEFRTELKSIGIDVNGFEGFLTSQGVQLQEIENRVQKLNQRMG